MKQYLIRHPQTLRNVEKKITGWEHSGYSPKGKKQFDKIVNYFKNNQIKYDIYSSDLPRALSLARAISKENKNNLKISKSLREKNFAGTKPYDSFEVQEDLKKRVLNLFEKIKHKDLILVTHSGVIETILREYLGEELKEFSNNTILLIETNKNQKRLISIRL